MLFGYDRGHRLLASSRGVPKTLASKILGDTDWDSRVPTKVDGYLSARPVRDEKSYVVLKTWRAPEMPRPGCVWTHVLVLSEADLSRISDLKVLAAFIKRPDRTDDFTFYRNEVDVETPHCDELLDEVDERLVRRLVELVYAGIYNAGQIERFDNLEHAMLALWSQQWPALRRRFSFRTAPLSPAKQSRRSGYEVELADTIPSLDLNRKEWWNNIAYLVSRDIVNGGTTPFRRFLWRYGADTSGEKEDLLFLARIYQMLSVAWDGSTNAAALITEIGKTFPEYQSAQLLKSDLTQLTDADYSLLPKFDQLDVALGIQSSRHASSFPSLGRVRQDTITQWLTNRRTELAKLLTTLRNDQSDFAASVFEHVATAKDQAFMWQLLEVSEKAFIRCVSSSPTFLDDDRIGNISDEGLVQIFETAQPKNAKPLKTLVPRLLSRSNTELISAVYSAAPKLVTAAVVDKLADELVKNWSHSSVQMNWIECVKGNSKEIVYFVAKSVETRAQLLVCRQLLSTDARKVPLHVWSSRLDHIKGDLPLSHHLDFQVFLLIQALITPDETAPVIVQDTFDDVYKALSGNRLRYRTESQLAEHLPSIGWLQNWDKCLRLQIAIVRIYKSLGLSKKKLRKITSDDDVRSQLEEIWSRA
ncbi:hypothetical protein [Rhodobium orientis]|nr:hypothetical protein [Rhodobium orientis]